jgi:polysaccharide export outer membrane protein
MPQPLKYLGIILMAVVIGSSSCLNTQQVSYFSNASDTTLLTRTEDVEAAIQKNDILSINISSLNAEASAVFNAPNSQATSTSSTTGSTASAGGYLVNPEGNIQLPILGNIRAAGLTKKQLKEEITNQILDKKLLLDPIVTIRHLNYEVTVIGEVAKPTVINVPNEKISLLKALGIAGDITVYGKKDNVLLIREVEGKRKVKRIDLNSKNFLTSSYYYLQPNDVVYVEPNKQKVIAANRNQQLLPTILSGLSIIALVVTQLVN